MTFKKKVFDQCLALLGEKIGALENMMRDLEQGAQNDNKSSAGDKHETARAMMQLEQEKISKQLTEVLSQKAALEKLGYFPASDIRSGSLVETNKGFLYLGVGPGRVVVDEKIISVLSVLSPLGKKLLGCAVGDVVEMNGNIFTIESIQ